MTKSKEFLSEVGFLPISADQPAGVDVRYDDDFDFIEDELSKQGSIIDRGQINWDNVMHTSLNILSNKSKDLKVSCYLTRALFENDGLPGLQAGLSINYQLLTTFWDDLFPIKPRARANAYEWLSDKFELLFDNLNPDVKSLTCLEDTYNIMQKIEQFLNEQLSDNAPALGNFRRAIYELLESVKQLKNNEDESKLKQQIREKEESNSNEHIQPVRESERSDYKQINSEKHDKDLTEPEQVFLNKMQIIPPVTKTDSISEKEHNKIIRHCHEALRNLSSCSINKSLDTPSAYAMNRFSTWMGISKLPMHQNCVTPLKPVPKDKVVYYTDLFNNKSYQELIPLVEQSFSKAPFWLDAHRLVSCSLEALGMNDASNQVKEYLAIFLRRFPELPDLKFSDQSAFADQSTRQWINSEIVADNSNQNNITANVNDTLYDEAIINKARDLAKQKKIKQAINLFQNNIMVQEDLRKKTFWKYHLAQFCYDNAQYKLAFFLLKEIDGFLQKYNLKYWEPDLEKKVVYLLILCLKNGFINSIDEDKTGNNKEHKEINKLYPRLCQLDPILALEVE